VHPDPSAAANKPRSKDLQRRPGRAFRGPRTHETAAKTALIAFD
jgi:hypothetical protein